MEYTFQVLHNYLKIGTSYSYSSGAINVFNLSSSINFVDACVVDVVINPSAQLQGLEVDCIGVCRVVHMGPDALNLGSGTLVLSGDQLDFMSVKTIASRVTASVTKGNLHFYSLTLTSTTQLNTISTGEGDVVVQSTDNMNIQWTQILNNICFYAPTIIPVGNSASTCQLYYNGGLANSACSQNYMLCKASATCSSSLTAASFSLATGVGNIYANVISSDGVPVTITGNNVKGLNYTLGPNFDSTMNLTIANYLANVGTTAQADPLFLISMGNSLSFSSSGMTFLIVANTAYLNAYPWWISFLSANLLLGNVYQIAGNLAPGFCPYNTLPTTGNLYSSRSLLLSRFSALGTKTDAAFLYAPEFPSIMTTTSPCSGFRGTEGTTGLYGFQLNGNTFQLQAFGLNNSIALLIAVYISILLGLIIGIIAMVLLLVVLEKLLDYYITKSNHIAKYAGRIKKSGPEVNLNIKYGQVADSRMQEKDKEEKDHHSLISILTRLPPQFMIIDIIVKEIRLAIISSAEVFFSNLFVEMKPDDIDDFEPMLLSDIKDVYEQYCFLKQYAEEDLLNPANIKRIEAKGFTFEKKGKEVDMLLKVKWYTPEEEFEAQKSIPPSSDNSTSLARFIQAKISKTPFEQDKIDFDHFKKKYEEFCEEKRQTTVVITRAQLHDAFAIDSESEVPYYLRGLAERSKWSKVYKVDLESIRKKNLMVIGSEAKSSKNSQGSDDKLDDKAEEAGYLSFVFDALAVILHIAWLAVLGGVVIILPLFIDLEMSRYNLSDYRYSIKYEDFMYVPWYITNKFKYLSIWTFVCIGIAAVYLIFGLIDLLIYYFTLTFPTASLRSIKNSQLSSIAKIFQIIEWYYIWIVISLGFMYLAIVGVWSILGAILNPDIYLAYGSAVVTFLTFAAHKIQEFKQMNSMGIEALQEMLFSKLQGFFNDIMKKVLNQAGFAVDLKPGQNIVTSILDRAESAVRASPIGKSIVALGLDPKTVVEGLQGNDEALIAIGEKQGIPKNVMQLALAMVKGQKVKIVKCIQDLACCPEIQIDPVTVQLGIDIISNSSEKNIPVLISQASKIFFDLLYQQVTKNLTDEQVAYLDICKQIFPRVFSSIQNFNPEDMHLFLDEFESINDYLISSVKKKSVSLTGSGAKVFDKFFGQNGEPTFALSPYVFHGLRIFNVLALGEGKADNATIERLLRSIYFILQNVLGIDRKVIDMLHLMTCTCPERLTSVDENEGLVPIEKQEQILRKSCDILGIPPILLNIAWKVFTGNFTIDEELIKQIEDFFVTKLRLNIPRSVLTTVMQIFSIASTRLSPSVLMESCSKFRIEGDLATIVYMFGKSKLTQAQCDSLEENAIFQAICNKMIVSPGQALGLISLLKGDYGNACIDELVDSLIKRWRLANFPVDIVVSVLVLILSKDESELLKAAKKLHLKPYELILIGKRILHPADVSDALFTSLGLSVNDMNIMHRSCLEFDNLVMWNDWIKSITMALSSGYRMVRNQEADKINAGVDDSTPTAQKGRGVAPMKKTEAITAEKAKETTEKFDAKTPVEANRALTKSQTSLIDVGFTAEEQEMRSMARLLLSIETMKLNAGTIKGIVSKLKIPVDEKTLESACDLISELLQALLSINTSSNISKVRAGIDKFAAKLQIEEELLSSIVNIICLHEKKEVSNGLAFMAKNILSKHEIESLQELSAFLLDKSSVIAYLDKTITNLATQFKIPQFFIKLLLCPLTGEDATKIGMEELLVLLDQAGIHPDAFKEMGMTLAPLQTGKPLTIEEFRGSLAGIIMGNNSVLRSLFKKLNFPEMTLDLVCGLTSGNFTEALTLCCSAVFPMFKKMGISENVVYILMEVVSQKSIIFSLKL